MPDGFDAWLKKQGAQQAQQPAPQPKPTGGSFDSWMRGQSKSQAKPPVAPRRTEFDPSDRSVVEEPTPTAEDFIQAYRSDTEDPEGRYRTAREGFARRGAVERNAERYGEAFTRGGGIVSKAVRQTIGFGKWLEEKTGLPLTPTALVPESALRSWGRSDAEFNRELEERRLARPSSLATDVGEGIVEAIPATAGLVGTGMLTGGGVPAQMALGAGFGAAGADWDDPKKAALQTATGAVAPVVGGKVGGTVGGVVAKRLASPVAQRLAIAGGEILGGGLGNVGGALATGETNPRELAKAGLIGAGLSVPGAIKTPKGGRGRPPGWPTRPQEVRPTERMPVISEQIAAENAPTSSELNPPTRAELRTGGLPELYSAPIEPFEVHTGKLGREYPGAVGPRANDELTFTASAKPKAPKAADIPESPSLGRTIGNTLKTANQAVRTVWTSVDLSAPLTQGAFLTIPHPFKAAQSFGQMFRSLSAKQSVLIDDAINAHPLRQIGEDFGLHVATWGAPEEAFMLKQLNRIPGISHSERTYRTYLDTLRLSVWESYVKSLQADGRTPENSPRAYKAAADAINIGSGRGALRKGGMLEKTTELAGAALFAPRNLIAKFQYLDPVRYASLPAGARKLVLRDAAATFGAMLGTATLLKSAGARVGFNPDEDDFMQARWGNTRYDLTFGLGTQIKFLAKMIKGTYNKYSGEGNLPGQEPSDVALRYGRGKLGPLPGLGATFLTGKDFKGEEIGSKSAGRNIFENAAPMIARDLEEGYREEGMAGLLKTTPAILGARVSSYSDRAKVQWLNEPAAWREEQKRAGEPRMHLEPKKAKENGEKDETPREFAARLGRVNELLGKYGSQLVASDAYKQATAEEKKAARKYLRQAIGRSDVNVENLDPLAILESVRESAYGKAEKERAAKLRR